MSMDLSRLSDSCELSQLFVPTWRLFRSKRSFKSEWLSLTFAMGAKPQYTGSCLILDAVAGVVLKPIEVALLQQSFTGLSQIMPWLLSG